MKKILSLMLLCATILFVSCKDDNETADSVSVDGVKLDKSTLSIAVGTSETLTATITPDNATNQNVSWQSSNTATATVDATGKVTAVAAGTTNITVTTEDGAKTDVCAVTVSGGPKYMIYGAKGDNLVFYDGTEIKPIAGFTSYGNYIKSCAQIGNDFYGLASDKHTILKNGVSCNDADKVPQNSSYKFYSIYASGTSLYVNGEDENGKATVWKDGQFMLSVDLGTSRFSEICVLGNDVFAYYSKYDVQTRISTYYVYKNNTPIYNAPDYRIEDMKVCGDKVYMVVVNSTNTVLRYIYDGTSMILDSNGGSPNLSKDKFTYFGYSGSSMYAIAEDPFGKYALYKGNIWNTSPKSAITPPASIKYFNIYYVGEYNNDVYEYGAYNVPDTDDPTKFNHKQAYGWKNSADPFRLPIDTINGITHISQ